MQPVVKPVEQPVEQPAASCKQTFNRSFNRFDNCLCRVIRDAHVNDTRQEKRKTAISHLVTN